MCNRCKGFNNPPNAFLINTTANPIGLPTELGANGCCVIQEGFGQGLFTAQIAFSFGNDKIAIRRKFNNKNWTDWRYIKAE